MHQRSPTPVSPRRLHAVPPLLDEPEERDVDPHRPLGPVVARRALERGVPLESGDERRLSPGVIVRHTGTAIEVEDIAGAGLSLFEARFSKVSVRPPCAISIGAGETTLELVHVTEDGGLPVASPLPGMVGTSRPMRELAFRIRRFAKVPLPVLIRGESGVGKDLVARALHLLGRPSNTPFHAINAATISRELAESELFGFHKGAFTGACKDRLGAFREANQGTLFIDEIASLGLDVQAKLLRVVEEGFVRPLGGELRVPVDVRLVVATCEPLERMVETGRFRADLYERLAVCVATVPPLHHRPSDIPAIARALIDTMGIGVRLSPGALRVLSTRRYRGNVRELRNVIAQSAMRTTTDVIETEHVLATFEERFRERRPLTPHEAVLLLDRCDGNISRAAREAGVPRTTMRDLLARASERGAPVVEEEDEGELAPTLEARLVG